MNEHDFEPVPGLPAPLPAGETILWQGAPRWQSFARHALRVRLMAAYFAVLAVWGIAERASSGMAPAQIVRQTLWLAGLAAAAFALLTLFAWLVARTTLYTVTTRRVIIRYGIALPIAVQIAFPMIDAAAVHTWADGSGDVSLTTLPGQRIAYMVMWPHTRPWRLTKAQPTLRGISDAAAVGQILGRALAASASQPARAVSIPAAAASGAGGQIAAAA